LGGEFLLTPTAGGTGSGVANLPLQLMGPLVVVQIAQLFAPIVRIGVRAQQIVRPQQQPVRVPCAKARIAVTGGTLQSRWWPTVGHS